MRIDIEQTVQLLRDMDNVLILAHEHPDGDAIGSSCALCLALISMGKKAQICLEKMPPQLEYLTDGVPSGIFDYKYIVTCDTADTKILGIADSGISRDSKIDLCIDHHYSNVLYAENTYLDSAAAGACEAMFDILKLLNIDITPKIAECMYVGIATDSGCFRYSNTTAKTLRTAAELLDLGVDNARVNHRQFETKSKQLFELEKSAISDMKLYFSDKCAVLIVSNAMITQNSAEFTDLSALCSLPREIEGVLVGITMKEKKQGEFRISIRTNSPADASVIARSLGGGGHKMAAACAISGTAEYATKVILDEVGAYLDREGLI